MKWTANDVIQQTTNFARAIRMLNIN